MDQEFKQLVRELPNQWTKQLSQKLVDIIDDELDQHATIVKDEQRRLDNEDDEKKKEELREFLDAHIAFMQTLRKWKEKVSIAE